MSLTAECSGAAGAFCGHSRHFFLRAEVGTKPLGSLAAMRAGSSLRAREEKCRLTRLAREEKCRLTRLFERYTDSAQQVIPMYRLAQKKHCTGAQRLVFLFLARVGAEEDHWNARPDFL